MFDRLLVPSIAPCPIGKFLAGIDPESSENLVAALADSGLSNLKIRRALIDEAEFKTSVETIGTHRKGECRCSTR